MNTNQPGLNALEFTPCEFLSLRELSTRDFFSSRAPLSIAG